MKIVKNLSLLIVIISIFVLSSCDKKVCDCSGIVGNKLSYKIDLAATDNCTVIEDFQFNADSTVNVFRRYKDPDGIERNSEFTAVTRWVLKNSTDCTYKVFDLRGQSYQFPEVVTDCNGTVDRKNSFFYDLQFQTSRDLTISDINCGSMIINGQNFTW